MQIVRTIVWVVLILALLFFSMNNWQPVEVRIWEGLVLETKIPALVLVAFLAGLLPMWMLHRGTRWHLNRRIRSLENAARMAAGAPVVQPGPADEPLPDSHSGGPEHKTEV